MLGLPYLLTLLILLPLSASAETHQVRMLTRGESGPMVFEPAYLEIAPGDRVRFVPTQRSHNAASIKNMAPEGATPFMGNIDEEIEVTFDIPGLYGVKCSPHFAMGMVMVIDVNEEAHKSNQLTLPDDLPQRARKRFEAILSDASSL